MKIIEIKIHNVKDGLPNMDNLIGRVACIFDGEIVSGSPFPYQEYPEIYTSEAIEEHTNNCLHGFGNIYEQEKKKFIEQLIPGSKNFLPFWEANEDVGTHKMLAGVKYWVEFPAPLWELTNDAEQ